MEGALIAGCEIPSRRRDRLAEDRLVEWFAYEEESKRLVLETERVQRPGHDRGPHRLQAIEVIPLPDRQGCEGLEAGREHRGDFCRSPRHEVDEQPGPSVYRDVAGEFTAGSVADVEDEVAAVLVS